MQDPGPHRPTPRLSWRLWAGPAVLGVLFLVFGGRIFRLLTDIYLTNGNYSHGFLIPLVAAYGVFRRRRDLAAATCAPGWAGLWLTAAGIVTAVLGLWYDIALQPRYLGYVFLLAAGLAVCLAGLCWTAAGTARMRILAFPLAYLAFALPLPESWVTAATLPLQSVAAAGAAATLRLLGLAVDREGNLLRVGSSLLGVDEACSGIRSIWVLLAAAVALAAFGKLRRGRALALVLSVPVLAVAINVVRIVVTGLLAERGHREAVQGAAHETLGLATAAFGGAVLFWLAHAWRPHGGTARAPAAGAGASAAERTPPSSRTALGPTLCAGALLVLGCAANRAVAHHYRGASDGIELAVQDRRPLSEFPAQLGRYSREASRQITRAEERELRPSDYLMAAYSDASGGRVFLTVLYWHPRRIRVTGSGFKFPHHVDDCYTYWGWARKTEGEQEAAYSWLPGETVCTRLFEKQGARHVILFWRSIERRPIVVGMFGQGLLYRLKALIRSWSDPVSATVGAQYAVIVAVPASGDAPSATETGLAFARSIAPVLSDFGIGQKPASVHGD
jgi:exosortase